MCGLFGVHRPVILGIRITIRINISVFNLAESALDPNYAVQLWETYTQADHNHPDFVNRFVPGFNRGSETVYQPDQYLDVFEIPITQFLIQSNYSIQQQFPINAHCTTVYIHRYHKSSYLNWHTDELGSRVCVVYLDPDWQPHKGGLFQHLGDYWHKHTEKKHHKLTDTEFYRPPADADIYQIEPLFNRAVYINNSDLAVLHRTTPILVDEPKVCLRIKVTEQPVK